MFRSAAMVGIPLALLALPDAAPVRPTDDARVLGRAAPAARSALAELEALDGRDETAVLGYARRALERARLVQDARHAGYALIALGRLHPAADAPEALLLEAVALQHLHRFDEAMARLDALIARPQAPAQAYFVRSALRTLRGDYAGARADCARLLGRVDALAVAICAALPNSRDGRARAVWSALSEMLASPGVERSPLLAHARGVQAELAWRLDRPEALDLLLAWHRGGDPLATVTYADALLDRGHPDLARAALTGLSGESAQVRRARALRALNPASAELAALIAAHEASRAARALRDDTAHRREDAYWLLHVRDAPADALELALANWQVQREPIDAELVLDAALRAGRADAAQPVLDWLAVHFSDDARLDARRHALLRQQAT